MMILGIPAIIALLGLFCGYFAVGLGKDPYRWFIIGSFTGPVGLIALFLLPVQQARCYLLCPDCSQIAGKSDTFCRYCGARMGNSTQETTVDNGFNGKGEGV